MANLLAQTMSSLSMSQDRKRGPLEQPPGWAEKWHERLPAPQGRKYATLHRSESVPCDRYMIHGGTSEDAQGYGTPTKYGTWRSWGIKQAGGERQPPLGGPCAALAQQAQQPLPQPQLQPQQHSKPQPHLLHQPQLQPWQQLQPQLSCLLQAQPQVLEQRRVSDPGVSSFAAGAGTAAVAAAATAGTCMSGACTTSAAMAGGGVHSAWALLGSSHTDGAGGGGCSGVGS